MDRPHRAYAHSPPSQRSRREKDVVVIGRDGPESLPHPDRSSDGVLVGVGLGNLLTVGRGGRIQRGNQNQPKKYGSDRNGRLTRTHNWVGRAFRAGPVECNLPTFTQSPL